LSHRRTARIEAGIASANSVVTRIELYERVFMVVSSELQALRTRLLLAVKRRCTLVT
jgi:hypothetical protein